jgi:hypothetical protein
MTATTPLTDQVLLDSEYKGRQGVGRCWNVVYSDGSLFIFSAVTRAAARRIATEYGNRIRTGVTLSSLQEILPDANYDW